MLDKLKKEIVAEFDEKFSKVNYDKEATYMPDYEQYPKLKQFISKAIKKAYKQGFDDAYEEAIERVKNFK
jgi:hypothetical protein